MSKLNILSIFQPFHGDCSWPGYQDEDGVQVCSALDARGREIPDGTPMAPPVGYRNDVPSLSETVHRMIHSEISRRAQEEGFETFDEADDFDMDDDPIDPRTPYEAVFDPPPPATPSAGPGVAPPASPDGKPGVGGTPTDASPAAPPPAAVTPSPPPPASPAS